MKRVPSVHLAVFLSGLAGLGYEIVWTRQLAIGLGHELPSALAVMAAFFGGMAGGAWLADRLRVPLHRLARAYAGIELAIGAWALATIPLVPWASRHLGSWIGAQPSPVQHWAVAFLATFALLLPATCAMGATLPVAARLVASTGTRGRPVSALYAANTAGALAGTLFATLALVPACGNAATLALLAAANAAAAAVVVLAPPPRARAAPPADPGPHDRAPALPVVLFATGLLGIGYEVLVVRVLSQVLEDTVYSFACALVVYLAGNALGAWLHHRLGAASRRSLPLFLTLTSLACLGGTAVLADAGALHAFVRAALGPGVARSIIAELATAAAAFVLPAIAMGATFAHLAEHARRDRLGLGGAVCVNTLGSALAPLAFGVVLVPLVGLKLALVACALGYAALAPLASARAYLPALAPAVAGVLLLAGGPLRIVTLGPGEVLVEHVEGVLAAVSVVRDAAGDHHLKVNDRFQMGGTSSAFSDLRQGHLPLLLHADPRDALYLGLGTAATFSAAAAHPGLSAEGVELVPEVVSVVRHFRKSTGDLGAAPGLSIVVADARRYVSASTRRYDVIVGDLFHPARDGAASLYTREHFGAIRSRLADGGVFVQWLPLYQLDLETFRTIVRTFLDVFPDGSAWLASYSLKSPIVGLVGSTHPLQLRPGWFNARVRDRRLAETLGRLRLRNDLGLLGGYLAGGPALRRFAGDGPLNTDDLPIVQYQAPRVVYGVAGAPAQRLLALVGALEATPEEVLGEPRDAEGRHACARLGAYWRARDAFLRAGAGVQETADPVALLAQVREPLLAILRESPEFDPAYLPLVALAARLRETDPAASEALLGDVERARAAAGEGGAAAPLALPRPNHQATAAARPPS